MVEVQNRMRYHMSFAIRSAMESRAKICIGYPGFFVLVCYVVSVFVKVTPQVLLVVEESVIDGRGQVLRHLSSRRVVTGSVEALMLLRPSGGLKKVSL